MISFIAVISFVQLLKQAAAKDEWSMLIFLCIALTGKHQFISITLQLLKVFFQDRGVWHELTVLAFYVYAYTSQVTIHTAKTLYRKLETNIPRNET